MVTCDQQENFLQITNSFWRYAELNRLLVGSSEIPIIWELQQDDLTVCCSHTNVGHNKLPKIEEKNMTSILSEMGLQPKSHIWKRHFFQSQEPEFSSFLVYCSPKLACKFSALSDWTKSYDQHETQTNCINKEGYTVRSSQIAGIWFG